MRHVQLRALGDKAIQAGAPANEVNELVSLAASDAWHHFKGEARLWAKLTIAEAERLLERLCNPEPELTNECVKSGEELAQEYWGSVDALLADEDESEPDPAEEEEPMPFILE